jgi:hypothetical protein
MGKYVFDLIVSPNGVVIAQLYKRRRECEIDSTLITSSRVNCV